MILSRPGDGRTIGVIAAEEGYLILDKPAGLLSVPGRTEPDCLEARVRERFPEALTVHRLDMATSGICVMARSPATQVHLQQQFERRRTSKTYEAIVWGAVEGEEGAIDIPIRRDWDSRPLQVIDHQLGKEAITRWRVVARSPGRTRLELRPETGRSHQLRLHMKAIGHPILGDEWYAHDEARAQSDRLLLHAVALGFEAPGCGTRVGYRSDAPF
jgi:tRNA pseudouridine32 synthase/23S rRNA pseudouridine746 synthase